MKIEVDKPPGFEAIVAAFPKAAEPGVIFAYGDTIFNPSNIVIPPALMAHEEVHGKRQLAPNGVITRTVTIEKWWEKYLADPEFRYNEELYAHAAELAELKKQITDRNDRAKLVMQTASRLIAPLYNYGVPKSLNQAITDLRYALEHRS